MTLIQVPHRLLGPAIGMLLLFGLFLLAWPSLGQDSEEPALFGTAVPAAASGESPPSDRTLPLPSVETRPPVERGRSSAAPSAPPRPVAPSPKPTPRSVQPAPAPAPRAPAVAPPPTPRPSPLPPPTAAPAERPPAPAETGGPELVTPGVAEDSTVIEPVDEGTMPADEFVEPGEGSCGLVGCGACGGCVGPLWVRAEYLLWAIEGFGVPPLVTTSLAGTTRELAGRLDQPTTTILFGDESLANDMRSGGRLRLGYWLDPYRSHGVEASYFNLGSQDTTFRAANESYPILARPFYNVEPTFAGADAELVAFPNSLTGNISVSGTTTFEGLNVLYRRALLRQGHQTVDFVVGWRTQRLSDDLWIEDFKTSTDAASGLAVGTTLEEFDHFQTDNVFHGAEFGLLAERRWGPLTFELATRLALGNNHAEAAIDGSTTVTVPIPGGAPEVRTTPAGLLAQESNIGVYQTDEFAVIPELGVTLGFDITYGLRVMVGYSFMYWSTVARAGNQIDTHLNLSQLEDTGLVGPERPQFNWVSSGVWVQGLSVGLDYRF